MKASLVLGVACALATLGPRAATLIPGGRTAGQEQQPIFRATSALVAVPVFVESGNTPVTDLTVDDFELRDNGVVQAIKAVDDASSPVDLVVVVDVSGSVVPARDRFRRDIERIPSLLEPEDRVRILAFGSSVTELVPWLSAGEVPAEVPLLVRGRTTLNDAVAAALMTRRVEGRRRLAAVLIAGADNLSAVNPSRIVDLAGRADIALYTYELDERALGGTLPGAMDPRGNLLPTMPPGGRLPSAAFRETRVPWGEAQARLALERAAERTGGRPRSYKNSAFDSLRELVSEFRHGYVLYFRPAEEPDTLWHDLSVTVRRPGGNQYTVRARSGYAQAGYPTDRPAPEQPPAPQEAPSLQQPGASAPRSGVTVSAEMIRSFLERYERGDHAMVAAEFRGARNAAEAAQLLRREGKRWISAGTVASTSRRRSVVASLALEVAAPTHSLPPSRIPPATDLTWTDQRPLVFWAGQVLAGDLQVSTAERAWYLAALAMLEGQSQFSRAVAGNREAVGLLSQAIRRVPEEGRHRWTDARVLEQWVVRGVQAPRANPDEVRRAYEAAVSRADHDLRAEIQLHVVLRFIDANKDGDEALRPIVDVQRREGAREAALRTTFAEGLASDGSLVYLARFLRGRIHDRLDDRQAAEAAYRAALTVSPRAQSASMPLATLLYLRGEDREAQQFVEAVLAAPGADNPWRSYDLGDYRLLPEFLDQVRAALRESR